MSAIMGMLQRRSSRRSSRSEGESIPSLVDQLAAAELEHPAPPAGTSPQPEVHVLTEAGKRAVAAVIYSPDELPRILGCVYDSDGLRALPRIAPVCSFWCDSVSAVVRRCGGLRQWGGRGCMAPSFGVMGPTYPVVLHDGTVAVGDVGPIKTHGESRSGRVKLLSPTGEVHVRSLGVDYPRGMAADGEHLYVINSLRDCVQKLRLSDGAVLDAALADGRMFGAEGVAYSEDKVFVADVGRGRIGVFDTRPELRWRGAYGSAGQSAAGRPAPGGQFQRPTGLATYGHELFVADTANHRVQVLLTLDGQPLRIFGGTGPGERGEGERAGEFRLPRGVAVDASGARLFVAEQRRVQVLTTQWGVPLQVLPLPGCGTLWGICVGPRYAHVVDNFRQSVIVLELCDTGVNW